MFQIPSSVKFQQTCHTVKFLAATTYLQSNLSKLVKTTCTLDENTSSSIWVMEHTRIASVVPNFSKFFQYEVIESILEVVAICIKEFDLVALCRCSTVYESLRGPQHKPSVEFGPNQRQIHETGGGNNKTRDGVKVVVRRAAKLNPRLFITLLWNRCIFLTRRLCSKSSCRSRFDVEGTLACISIFDAAAPPKILNLLSIKNSIQ
mmetsp:Transcript_23290/g.34974  ORF Transcript_23290/g.34974 Transcript_23290/m.34974 type:complete len:205 (-) Transcript_23290:1095-1709(-)